MKISESEKTIQTKETNTIKQYQTQSNTTRHRSLYISLYHAYEASKSCLNFLNNVEIQQNSLDFMGLLKFDLLMSVYFAVF